MVTSKPFVVVALATAVLLQFVSIDASSSFPENYAKNATVVADAQSPRRAVLASKDDDDGDVVERLLAQGVTTQVVQRFTDVPAGYRKHPSYYSETYLRRARPYEQSDLAQKWGKWTYVDPLASSRPENAFYDQFPNRDVPRTKFPSSAWQTDEKHLSKFLPEAMSLTDRALEAILSEYGRGKEDMPGQSFEVRSSPFQPKFDGTQDGGEGGMMPRKSFEGLQRRILHAIMTEDRFVVAMSGHSAAAGHGNHFQQTYTVQIQRILEPIFARLGVKMSGRNFGMGGLGTLHNTVAGGDIFGRDVDILMWDSGMTERELEARGIMAVQGLVGIDKAPLLWFASDEKIDVLKTLHTVTGADVAEYGRYPSGLQHTVGTMDELVKLPWALQFSNCPSVLKEYCSSIRYNGTCWIDRSNFKWEDMNLSYTPEEKQQKEPGGRAGWHPGNREHQLTGRQMTFTILLALRDVLKMWNDSPGHAIDDNAWHVTEYYGSIQKKVVENKDKWVPWCRNKQISDKFCFYGAKGRTENTPRTRPWETSLRAIMAGSEHPNIQLGINKYDPPDVYNPTIDPPLGEIDVLAIVENGVDFAPNQARIRDSAENMQGRDFSKLPPGRGSKFSPTIITGGKGWELRSAAASVGTDNCDGQYDSFCHRTGRCLMYGHNDERVGLIFDGYSGWMIFNLPKVEHGVIMIKVHTWAFDAPVATRGWCSENNVLPCTHRELSVADTNHTTAMTTSSSRQRQLKPKVPDYCEQFTFEFAIDGIVTTWDKNTWGGKIKYAQRVVEFIPLLEDETWTTPKDVELAIRLTGCGRQKPIELTHIYWI